MALTAFQKAFKEARARGDSDFEFGGKQYNTKYKEEVDTPSKPSKSSSSSPPREAAIAEANDQTSPPPKKSGGIGPYNVGAGPSDVEKQATYSKYAENRRKMGDSGDDDSGSKPISESDWAKSVRASQASQDSDSGFLGKKMREALGSSYKKGGSVSASRRADGIAQRGKTKGKYL